VTIPVLEDGAVRRAQRLAASLAVSGVHHGARTARLYQTLGSSRQAPGGRDRHKEAIL